MKCKKDYSIVDCPNAECGCLWFVEASKPVGRCFKCGAKLPEVGKNV